MANRYIANFADGCQCSLAFPMSMSNRLLQKGFQPISLLLLLSAYGCLFLFLLWAAYTNRLPLDLLSTIPNYDKLGHLILYCIPSYLGHRLCRQKQVKRVGVSLPVFPGLFALFTIVEELIQGLSPYRTLDAGDMICSLVGIWVGCWLAQRRDSK